MGERDPRARRGDDELIDLRVPASGAPAMAWAMPTDEVDDRVATVNAWAERLRAKKHTTKARLTDSHTGDGAGPTDAGPTYWSTDALFAESRSVEDDFEQPAPSSTHRSKLLAVLGLDAEADASEAHVRFKQLVKQHHPDRWVDAEPALREEHAEHMRRVNAAWRALRPYFA